LYNSGSDEDEQNNNPDKRPNVKFTEQTPFSINTRDLPIMLGNVRDSIINFRSMNTTNRIYGTYMVHNSINRLGTMRQVMHYIDDNRDQRVTISGNRIVPLGFLLSNDVIHFLAHPLRTSIYTIRWPGMFAFFDALNHIMSTH
jgi:hypothetical protein